MKTTSKRDFPVANIRRLLEPGPVVLVSSQHKGQRDIMTMGWHLVMEFTPSLIGCIISEANHSHALIKASKQCVINVPTVDMIDTVVGIGNTDGDEIDKFAHFGLTAQAASKVKAPLIRECYANIECKLVDARMLKKYNFFILEAVKCHAPKTPKYPKTVHYTGDGVFMLSGDHVNKAKLFKPEML